MAASMRGAQSHNRMDDQRATRAAIAAAFADDQAWLADQNGEQHIGLKKLRSAGRISPFSFLADPYVREVMGQSATDEPFVSLTERNAWYRGKVCVCGCGAGLHEWGSRICMNPHCDCTSFEEPEEPVDYGMLSLEVGRVADLEDWELHLLFSEDLGPDLGDLYDEARRDDGDLPDVPTFLARFTRGAYE